MVKSHDNANPDRKWGDYYFAGSRQAAKKSWLLEVVYKVNQMIPSFNELFDQETFYVFAFCVVIGSFFIAFLMVKFFKVRIREYQINVDREWRDWKPANITTDLMLKILSISFHERCTIEYMLQNYDCVVQAPTGSGKTLAYLIPTLQLLMHKKKPYENATESNSRCEVIALIVAPGKELVSQIGVLAKPLCEKLGFNLLCLFGGAKKSPEKMLKGQCVIISTPGRMDNLISKINDFRTYLKALEVLIIDEADKFSDVEFQKKQVL
ncbi:DEAD/DEAH box helicase domain-containing protein [Ditylenchus destructor]|uniref:ATP-dependent RNA helicase n=1 Tax=Ditylenchus destructor TaxID=166010 RepID=A0AAD4RD41_9BILA|nr:DEAD/DEAH box helicase domain-containing protein [Ditylenchus destructor]